MALLLMGCRDVSAAPPQLPCVAVSSSAHYLGVRERTGHNDHPLIDKWAKEVGLDNKAQIKQTGMGYSWCLLFVRGMYQEASTKLSVKNPLPKIAGVVNLFEYAKANELRFKVIDTDDVIAGVEKAVTGDILIMIHKGGKGHTGIITPKSSNLQVNSREGNTNQAGSREGDGVYNKVRTVSSLSSLIRVK